MKAALAIFVVPALLSSKPAWADTPAPSEEPPPAPAAYPGAAPIASAVPVPVRTAFNAVYVELFGNCVLYSLNYDRMLTDAVSLRAGFMYLASARETIMMIPLMASYLFGSGNHKVELGAGLLVTNGPAEATEIASGFALGPWGSVWGTAVVGYRYAPREGGFLFRAGFTPTFNVLPLFGVSVGYAF